jgi:CRISPR-associated protein Cmr6
MSDPNSEDPKPPTPGPRPPAPKPGPPVPKPRPPKARPAPVPRPAPPRSAPPRPRPPAQSQVPPPGPLSPAGRQSDGQRDKQRDANRRRPGGRGSAGPTTAVGPLRQAIGTDGTFVKGPTGVRFDDHANALILMRRVAFVDGDGAIDKKGAQALLRWAVDQRLGQDPGLLATVAARRSAALATLRRRGHTVVRLRVAPEWRLAVGLGNRGNPHEIGLSLHGTYGWPIIPGSSVKGLTVAWAEGLVRSGVLEAAVLDELFGTPRPRRAGPPDPAQPAGRGSVRFLDAIPAGAPVMVTADVVTPHAQPYYAAAERGADPVPPAEHHQPIPSEFLVVSGGEFAVDLVGPADGVRLTAGWCAEAFDELGMGGKTGAGYGYATVTRVKENI